MHIHVVSKQEIIMLSTIKRLNEIYTVIIQILIILLFLDIVIYLLFIHLLHVLEILAIFITDLFDQHFLIRVLLDYWIFSIWIVVHVVSIVTVAKVPLHAQQVTILALNLILAFHVIMLDGKVKLI